MRRARNGLKSDAPPAVLRNMLATEASPQRFDLALPWLGLWAAFSPVLLELWQGIPLIRFSWSLLLGPVLIVLALSHSERSPGRRPGVGLTLVGVGLGLEAVGLLGGAASLARLGLPVAILGLSLWNGSPAPRIACLAFASLPLPYFVYEFSTPALEGTLAGAAGVVLQGLGASVEVSGPVIRHVPDVLELAPWHGGAHLVWLLGWLGWYGGLVTRRGLGTSLLAAGALAFLAFPLQLLATVLAAGLLVLGHPELATAWLDQGLGIALGAVVLASSEWIRRRSSP